MILYLIYMYSASLALGYVLAFIGATLSIGKSLSYVGTSRGYQDAITPPMFSTIAIVIYIICAGGLIYGFWRFGWLGGLGTTVAFCFVVALNKMVILPKSDSEHFRKIILNSIKNRHTQYLKADDILRASAMEILMEKLGIPVDA